MGAYYNENCQISNFIKLEQIDLINLIDNLLAPQPRSDVHMVFHGGKKKKKFKCDPYILKIAQRSPDNKNQL